jgi:CSLREA domain-containing protein
MQTHGLLAQSCSQKSSWQEGTTRGIQKKERGRKHGWVWLVWGCAFFSEIAWAATFTVNTTDDVNDGICGATHCGLREAINAANANAGMDTIAFNIPGAGPHTIQPGSGGLPEIADPVIIDGYTQLGASANTNPFGQSIDAVLKIELSGASAGANGIGLAIGATAAPSSSRVHQDHRRRNDLSETKVRSSRVKSMARRGSK